MCRVYFLRCEHAIKIGRTQNHGTDRLRSMQTGNPFEIEHLATIKDAGYGAEEYLHDFFHNYRIRGEWFEAEPVQRMLPLFQRITSEDGLRDWWADLYGETYDPSVNYEKIGFAYHEILPGLPWGTIKTIHTQLPWSTVDIEFDLLKVTQAKVFYVFPGESRRDTPRNIYRRKSHHDKTRNVVA